MIIVKLSLSRSPIIRKVYVTVTDMEENLLKTGALAEKDKISVEVPETVDAVNIESRVGLGIIASARGTYTPSTEGVQVKGKYIPPIAYQITLLYDLKLRM